MTTELKASKAYDAFKLALKQQSLETEKTYEACLWAFMDARNLTIPDQLFEGTQQEKEDAIRDFIKDKSFSMANKTFWALRKFYSGNRITLDWEYVKLAMPKPRDNPEEKQEDPYRPYRHDEIAHVWQAADSRQLVATGIMSSGVRSGGLSPIRINDLVWMEKYQLYAIRVYSFSKKDAYWAFATPQVSLFISDYLKKVHKGKSDYLFVDKREPSWHVTTDAIESDIYRLLIRIRIRTPGEDSETQVDHGFRKFFRTQLEVSRISDDAAERLMGRQTKRLKQIYSMPEPDKLLEATEYVKAIANLTIAL